MGDSITNVLIAIIFAAWLMAVGFHMAYPEAGPFFKGVFW